MNDSRLPEVRAPGAEARLPWAMLVTISVVTFLVNGSAVALAPFLLDVSRDLGVTLGVAANLIALMSISWGVVSVTAGAASDRIGRRASGGSPPRRSAAGWSPSTASAAWAS